MLTLTVWEVDTPRRADEPLEKVEKPHVTTGAGAVGGGFWRMLFGPLGRMREVGKDARA